MRRDLGNEVIVAIAAVGILAFAITFAIILSLSSPSNETGTATPMSSMVDEVHQHRLCRSCLSDSRVKCHIYYYA